RVLVTFFGFFTSLTELQSPDILTLPITVAGCASGARVATINRERKSYVVPQATGIHSAASLPAAGLAGGLGPTGSDLRAGYPTKKRSLCFGSGRQCDCTADGRDLSARYHDSGDLCGQF